MVNGIIIPISGGGSPVMFQYRPTEVHESYSAVWVPLKTAGREVPFLQYSNGDEDILEFTLRFTAQGSAAYVKQQLKGLKDLAKPSVKLAGMAMAPILMVILGADIQDQYVLKNPSIRKHTWADDNMLWHFGDARLVFSRYKA